MPSLTLHEILGPTIQGEGILTGCPSMFVRVQGCSLRCPNCDTKRSWHRKVERTPLAVIQNRLQAHPDIDIVITGGEPLDHEHVAGVVDLAQWSFLQGRRVTIETSGCTSSKDAPPHELFGAVALWSISPKLPAMGFVEPQVNPAFAKVITWWARCTQLKFVVSPQTLDRDLAMIRKYLDIYKVHRASSQLHILLQVAAPIDPAEGAERILDDWGVLVERVLTVPWLQRFRPQILPQAHRLIGVD